VFPKKVQPAAPPPEPTAKPTTNPEQTQTQIQDENTRPSSNTVTPEYLDFVKKELKKITGSLALDQDKIEQKLAGLRFPSKDQKRKNAEESLRIRGVPTFKVWKSAQGGAGPAEPESGQSQDTNPPGQSL
jgi:hypothetical protein